MPRPEPLSFLPGDLLFFWGRSWKSLVIETMTRGPSHVGMITRWCRQPDNVLCESTTLCELPDLETGKKIDGVQIHGIAERVNAYDGSVALLKLRKGRVLEPHQMYDLRDWLDELHGAPYDLRGAIRSGTRLYKWLPFVPYPDLGHLFCSELVAEMLMRLGRLPIWDPSVYNPASLLSTLLRCASYDRPVRLK